MNDLDRLKRSISETYDLEVKHIELIYNAINKILRITRNNDTLILKLLKKKRLFKLQSLLRKKSNASYFFPPNQYN
ncbi:hypothetical protein EMIT0P74_190042 [Pseudomonas sp. IT-P74]